MKKICPICNQEFEGRSNQKFCKNQHYKICEVCGKEFPITLSQIDKKTCSKECHDILAFKNMQATVESRKYTKICKLCGKEFQTSYNFQTICGDDHYGTCIICDKQFKYTYDNYTVQTCSKECNDVHRKQTCLEKYGASAPMGSAAVQAKSKQTCLEKYGVENVFQSEEFQSKCKATMIQKYGVKYSWESDKIRAKSRATMKIRHGGDHISKCPQLIEKMKQRSFAKYGVEWPLQSDEVRKKSLETVRKKYGVDNPFQSELIKSKIRETNRIRYGADYATQNPDIIKKVATSRQRIYAETIQDEVKRANYLEFIEDPVKYVQSHFEDRPSIHDLQDSIGGLDLSTIYDKLGPYEGARLLSRVRSLGENELEEFILSLDSSIVILKDCRNVISPKEIDLYLPDYNFGIEWNPTYTHNSSIPSFNSSNVLPYTYHKMKTDMCEEAGIFLFHLFGYEWSARPDVIKSMIRNILGKCEYKYYARNLKVVDVSYAECKQFLDLNHRQGSTSAKIRLGLQTSEGELISVMTFDKIRPTIGSKKDDTSDSWELSRFCSKLNTNVVGGASKLFAYFRKNFSYDKIISFSDRAHTRGSMYQTLGFEKVNVSAPNYVWVCLADDSYRNRVTCQKRNLPKLFNEPNLDIENQTEKQIMMSHGFVQVFDSGTIRWEYTNH